MVLKRVKKKYMNMFVFDQGLLKNTGIKDLKFAMFQELVLCLERNIYYFCLLASGEFRRIMLLTELFLG